MDTGDVLGDDGRKALDACVKVKIIGRPEIREYDWKTALERLQSCYGGSFPQGFSTWSIFDPLTLFDVRSGHNVSKMKKKFDIVEIYEALLRFDEMSYVEQYPREGPGSEKSKLIDKRRADIKSEFEEASKSPGSRLQYAFVVAQRRVRDCYAGNFAGDVPTLEVKCGNYSITDIHEAVERIDKEGLLLKYPEDEGPGSDELKNLINENRTNLKKEYKETTRSAFATEHEYSRSEAERQVRNCFAGSFLGDTDIFPAKRHQSEMTYDIFNIKAAVDHFDKKKLIDKYPQPGKGHDQKKQQVDEERACIRDEYERATNNPEIEHGSGFIIHDSFVMTCEHVINTYLGDKEKYNIHILNAAIGELPCKVAYYDPEEDLALLYCPKLNFKQTGIRPLQLSGQSLKEGFAVICFGYPINYKGEKALFVDGKVSGFKEPVFKSGVPLAILDCSLYSGNSGGPVLHRIKGELKVVGVVKQRHRVEILTPDEIMTIINSVQGSNDELALRIHAALRGTHSPFNFGNALQVRVMVKFIGNFQREYAKEQNQD
ncbi:hypothetical protein ACROYT_G009844 [Oculina patagonica]